MPKRAGGGELRLPKFLRKAPYVATEDNKRSFYESVQREAKANEIATGRPTHAIAISFALTDAERRAFKPEITPWFRIQGKSIILVGFAHSKEDPDSPGAFEFYKGKPTQQGLVVFLHREDGSPYPSDENWMNIDIPLATPDMLLYSDNGANAAYQITKKIVELETGWAINEKTTF